MIQMIERPVLRGSLRYTVYKNGVPIERFEDNNLIMGWVRHRIVCLITGDKTEHGLTINRIAVGTSGDVPTVNDTKISAPFVKSLERFDYPAADQVRFYWKLLESEANGKAIREFGLLTVRGKLFARRIRDKPLLKELDISIEGEWIIAV